jgi:hypothetical protein
MNKIQRFVIVETIVHDGLEEALNYCKREGLEITKPELIECFKTAMRKTRQLKPLETMKVEFT